MWYQMQGQIPCIASGPAPHASAVSKPKPAIGNGSWYSWYCLMKLVIWLPARFEMTRSGWTSRILRNEGAEVGGVGGHQLVGDELAAVLLDEAVGDAEEVVAEGVVGGQAEPLLALDHAVAEQRLAAGLDVHRVGGLDVKHVAIAVRAAERVRVAARC